MNKINNFQIGFDCHHTGGLEDKTQRLPNEIIDNIFSHLKDEKDFIATSLVCRRWCTCIQYLKKLTPINKVINYLIENKLKIQQEQYLKIINDLNVIKNNSKIFIEDDVLNLLIQLDIDVLEKLGNFSKDKTIQEYFSVAQIFKQFNISNVSPDGLLNNFSVELCTKLAEKNHLKKVLDVVCSNEESIDYLYSIDEIIRIIFRNMKYQRGRIQEFMGIVSCVNSVQVRDHAFSRLGDYLMRLSTVMKIPSEIFSKIIDNTLSNQLKEKSKHTFRNHLN